MSDFMRWMYQNYIRPQIEKQPKDIGEIMQFELVFNELSPHLRQELQDVLAFYAVQGFRLGVRTAVTLQPDL